MARARNIKPGFFKNEDLGTADPFVALLFAGLWMLADKSGILEDRPLRIKAELFPYREGFDINGYITVLVTLGFIHRYEVGGLKLIQIAKFKEHQNPHHTEKDSEYPSYSIDCKQSVKQPLINGYAPADSLIPDSLIPDSLIPDSLIPDSLIPEKSSHHSDYSEDFELAWAFYPKRPGANKKEAFKAWSARTKAGASVDSMIEGVKRYAAFITAEQTEPRFIKQAVTFFGPAEHFLSDWTIQKAKAPVTAKSAQLDTADQIFRRGKYGNDGQITDFDGIRSVESGGARIPETFDGVWKSDAGEVERNGNDGRLSGLGGSDAGFDA